MRRSALTIMVIGLSASEGHADRIKIEWPSREFRNLQSAIDAAPDGALIEFEKGTHEIGPVYIRGKRLEIAGAGSGRRPETPVTELAGAAPVPVVDEAGNLLHRAEAVVGMFNLIGAEVAFRDLRVTGSDAALVVKDDEAGNSSSARIEDVVIDGAGRGILSLGSGGLTIEDTDIQNTLWHGISVKSFAFGALGAPFIDETKILNPLCAGIYFENTTGIISNVSVTGALCGGIVGFQSQALVFDSILLSNRWAGIILVETTGLIRDNGVLFTLPTLNLQNAGDGISIFSSPDVFLDENQIHASHRAGVGIYGSTVSLADNIITCSAFDVDVETYDGVPSHPEDAGGNQCGCGGPLGPCEAVSAGPPVAPSLNP